MHSRFLRRLFFFRFFLQLIFTGLKRYPIVVSIITDNYTVFCNQRGKDILLRYTNSRKFSFFASQQIPVWATRRVAKFKHFPSSDTLGSSPFQISEPHESADRLGCESHTHTQTLFFININLWYIYCYYNTSIIQIIILSHTELQFGIDVRALLSPFNRMKFYTIPGKET